MIEVSHVSKRFGNTPAVRDLSFTVREGETFILLGTSGCGKTTTLKMINRLMEPDAGEICINGKNIKEERPELLRRRIGYVMQHTGLFPHYTIWENISVVPGLLGWDTNKTLARAKILLEKFNLSPELHLNIYPNRLSGGQQQRAGFVRALMADPPILLMDEPLGALDPITRRQIRQEFKQLDELSGKTIILVTHDIGEAIELGDRICLMDKGSALQSGTATELLLDPANDLVRHFFSADQLTLQLRAIHLGDLLPFFPVAGPQHTDPSLNTESTVLQTVEKLIARPPSREKLIVADENGEKYYHFDLPDLLTAFRQKIGTRTDGSREPIF